MREQISDQSLALLAVVSELPERNQNFNRDALSITVTPAYICNPAKLTLTCIPTLNDSHPSIPPAISNFLDSTTATLEYNQGHLSY